MFVSKYVVLRQDNNCVSPAFTHKAHVLFCSRLEKLYVYSAVKYSFEFK